jgi:hypothetical protein
MIYVGNCFGGSYRAVILCAVIGLTFFEASAFSGSGIIEPDTAPAKILTIPASLSLSPRSPAPISISNSKFVLNQFLLSLKHARGLGNLYNVAPHWWPVPFRDFLSKVQGSCNPQNLWVNDSSTGKNGVKQAYGGPNCSASGFSLQYHVGFYSDPSWESGSKCPFHCVGARDIRDLQFEVPIVTDQSVAQFSKASIQHSTTYRRVAYSTIRSDNYKETNFGGEIELRSHLGNLRIRGEFKELNVINYEATPKINKLSQVCTFFIDSKLGKFTYEFLLESVVMNPESPLSSVTKKFRYLDGNLVPEKEFGESVEDCAGIAPLHPGTIPLPH